MGMIERRAPGLRSLVLAIGFALLASVPATQSKAQALSRSGDAPGGLESLVASGGGGEKKQRSSRKVRISLLSEFSAIRPGQPFWVALRQEIAPGWHTYWENPGDSGEPTRITWNLPEDFEASDIEWPAPEAIRVSSLMNYGYAEEALLLVRITPPRDIAAEQVTLRAESNWLVCEEICIPESGAAALTLDVAARGQPPQAGQDARQITAAVRALPKPAPWPVKLTVAPEKLALSVETASLDPANIEKMRFFPREWGLVDNAAPQPVAWENGKPRLVLSRGEMKDKPIDRLSGLLVITKGAEDGREAFEVSATPDRTVEAIAAPAASASGPTAGLGLWQAAAFAFIGGLILNLFPCVFPVLSMKALSLARGTESAGAHRSHALSYFGGVMLSFAVLAALLLALRATGAVFGWGFQFQSPWFVLAMAALFFALGLSLSGVFNFGGALMGVGDSLTRRGGAAGSFFTGVLASIAATPCTAPFMGAALGYAVTQPAIEATTVVMMLGLGFAVPMTLLSLSGAFARLLPKPGPWMETLKQVLAFPLYATAVWLVWVLSLQTGANGVLAAGGVLLAIGFAAWLAGMTSARRSVRYPGSAAVVVAAFAVAGPMIDAAQPPPPAAGEQTAATTEQAGEPFSRQRLDSLLAEGRPVFVNFTAAWCITCKVNEEVALKSDAFRAALARGNIAYLIGDWTNQDPEISRMLEKFGRAGVPLYLLYPGNGQPPEVLPQILTKGVIQRRFAPIIETRTSRR